MPSVLHILGYMAQDDVHTNARLSGYWFGREIYCSCQKSEEKYVNCTVNIECFSKNLSVCLNWVRS